MSSFIPEIWTTALRAAGVPACEVAVRYEQDGEVVRAIAGGRFADVLLDDLDSVQRQPRIVDACAKALARSLS